MIEGWESAELIAGLQSESAIYKNQCPVMRRLATFWRNLRNARTELSNLSAHLVTTYRSSKCLTANFRGSM